MIEGSIAGPFTRILHKRIG